MRRKVLDGQDIERTTLDMLGDITSLILDNFVPLDRKREDWNLEGLRNAANTQFGLRLEEDLPKDGQKITQLISQGVKNIYDRQKTTMGAYFEQIQKMVLLQTIDQRWKEHLLVIDKLKEGIGLRGYAQKDPIIEYKKEAFQAFENLNNAIKGDAIEKMMKVQIVAQQAREALDQFRPDSVDMDELDYRGATEDGGMMEMAPQASRQPSGPQKRKMTMTSEPPEDQKMNRADRRRLEKNKRKN
jgi:preprotein translocase subunit SecA